MAKYLIKHWFNVDVIAEKIVDESDINLITNNLGKHKIPDGTFNFIMVKENTNMSLNPYWVEALMGLPQGWTALDGTETEMQGTWEDSSWEEGIPRVIKDCLNRIDRIRMCGNGVVPQTAALAWKVLSNKLEDEYER